MVDNVQDIELGTLTPGGWDVTAGERVFSPVIVIAQSAVAVSVGATTDETVVATVNIPAGIMGLNGRLRITQLWTHTSSGNNKTLRVRLGGIGGTAFGAVVNTTSAAWKDTREIANRGAANSQVGMIASGAGANTLGGSPTTGAVDTAAATTLVITGQKAASGEILTLESWSVELLPSG